MRLEVLANMSSLTNVVYVNRFDDNGNPAGGSAEAIGIDLKWQDGPLGRGEDRKEPNGTFVETVLFICQKRLEFYQDSRFKCRENAIAITKIEEALHWLDSRTKDRETRAVEGTHAA